MSDTVARCQRRVRRWIHPKQLNAIHNVWKPKKATLSIPSIVWHNSTRTVDITLFRTSLRVGVDEPRDPEPEIEVKPWLELQGVLNEPVRQTSDIVLSLYPDATTKVGTARVVWRALREVKNAVTLETKRALKKNWTRFRFQR